MILVTVWKGHSAQPELLSGKTMNPKLQVSIKVPGIINKLNI